MWETGASNVNEGRVRVRSGMGDRQRQPVLAGTPLALNEQRAACLSELSGLFEQPLRSGISRYVLRQYHRCFCRHTRQEDFLFFLPPVFFFAIARGLRLAALRGPALLLLFAERVPVAFFGLLATAFLTVAAGFFSRSASQRRRADFHSRSRS